MNGFTEPWYAEHISWIALVVSFTDFLDETMCGFMLLPLLLLLFLLFRSSSCRILLVLLVSLPLLEACLFCLCNFVSVVFFSFVQSNVQVNLTLSNWTGKSDNDHTQWILFAFVINFVLRESFVFRKCLVDIIYS